MNIEKISAVTVRVSDMARSVKFYRDILGIEMTYGGEDAEFSSFKIGEESLNLEHGKHGWARIIIYVDNVDEFWRYLNGKGLNLDKPRNASWGERYFHAHDPDGHEVSFAKLL